MSSCKKLIFAAALALSVNAQEQFEQNATFEEFVPEIENLAHYVPQEHHYAPWVHEVVDTKVTYLPPSEDGVLKTFVERYTTMLIRDDKYPSLEDIH